MVLLAEDTHLDRQIALKVMLPKAAAKSSAKERFLREAKTAAVKHDNVVSIYQVGEDRGGRVEGRSRAVRYPRERAGME